MRPSPLYQLLRSGNLGVLDDLVDASADMRTREAKSHGVGHILAYVVEPPTEAGAYAATITTPAGKTQLTFNPDSPAARLLHSVGVTKIPAKRPVSAYVPLDIAVKLAEMAERPA
jgi:hypothetical protein